MRIDNKKTFWIEFKLLKYLLSFGVRMSAIECRLSSELICDAFGESIKVALPAVTFIAKFWAISAAENACGQWWSLLCGSWILKVLSSWKYKQDLNNRLGRYLRCLLFRCICNTQQCTSMSNELLLFKSCLQLHNRTLKKYSLVF